MDSEIRANKEVIQPTCSLIHPLAELELAYLPRSSSNPATIDFRDPQPVFLNGDVYMKGYILSGQYRIWKYSSSANVFSEILVPEGISDKFVLTLYNSQLLLIDAVFEEPDESDEDMATRYPEYKLHKLDIYPWILVNDNRFERTTAVPHYVHRSGNPMPLNFEVEYEPLEPFYWEIRATSKDGNLVVAFYRQDDLLEPCTYRVDMDTEWFVTIDILVFENSKKGWIYKERTTHETDQNYKCDDDDDGSERSTQEDTAETIIDRPSITINNDTLYVKLWNERGYKDDKNYCELAKVPILGYSLEFLPSLTLPKGHSNLSVLNNHIVIAIPRDDELFLLALLETKPRDIWIEIAHIKLSTKFDSTPCIVGLPDDGNILVIGMMKCTLQSGIQTSTLKTLKLTSKVATYNPTSQLSLSTINKLQIGLSICFLSNCNLEENYNRLQELAGFELDCSHDYTFYTRSLLPKYIKSWAESINCSLTLTWKNFLHILREMKLTDVAKQIEKFLIEFTEVHEHQLQAPDATGGEEIADLRGKFDALHQELDKGDEATEAPSFGLIKEKVKACLDQSQIAFNKIRMERMCLQEQIDELTKQKLELENKVEALEQGPPAKRLCLSKIQENDTGSQQPTLKYVLRELYNTVANKWEDIGIQLDIDDGELAKVKADHPGETGSCLREMLRIWFKKVQHPSWNVLVEALKYLGENKLAQQLKEKYCA